MDNCERSLPDEPKDAMMIPIGREAVPLQAEYQRHLAELLVLSNRRYVRLCPRSPCLDPGEGLRRSPLPGQGTGANRADAWHMIRRPAEVLGFRTMIGSHTIRETGITTYLEASTLGNAQVMATHESPRTPKICDRYPIRSHFMRCSESRFDLQINSATSTASSA